jgi:uncharacterized protein (TIGR02421 family)
VRQSTIDDVVSRMEARKPVRLELGAGGRLLLERGLPYLLVYRSPSGGEDVGTSRLLAGEAAVLTAMEGEEVVLPLVRQVVEAGSGIHGAFLLLELWAGPPDASAFVLRGPAGVAPETSDALLHGLRDAAALHPGVEVRVEVTDDRAPPGMGPLLSIKESWEREVLYLGLEVPPVFRQAPEGPLYPRFHRRLQRALSRALRQALYEFIRVQTTVDLENYQALGTRTVPDTIWHADRELAEIERSFSLLILTSPVNEAEAWQEFRSGRCQQEPVFHYRLLPVDPDLLKRRLYNVPIETIDDPALAYLMQDKREDLDRQLSMLGERGSDDFRYSSMRLYGTVDDRLAELATDILRSIPPPPRHRTAPREVWVDAEGFRRAAEEEFAYYRERDARIATRRIDIRPDLMGLMVSEGNLLIGATLRVSPARVAPLIHHEIGTHVLTYVNGSAQPMQQLALGLAGYDELQEGLAVLAEYLADGLDRARMRLLAARVLAARAVEQGATFVKTFGLLTGGYGFSPAGAWHLAVRVYSCGGFTRDLIYLRGLVGLLDHLAGGGDLRPLYLGKIAQKHLGVIEELRHRNVLRDAPLTPRLLNEPAALARLDALRAGLTPLDLVKAE